MTRMFDNLLEMYYNWIISKIDYPGKRHYRHLLQYLYSAPFIPLMDMDVNRETDGSNLVRQFGYEVEIDTTCLEEYNSNGACSILEMMVALAIRCEDSIMTNPKFGDRTGYWFWQMVDSLGLSPYTDDVFLENIEKVKDILDTFTRRKYRRNGMGGLFYVPRCKKDMRTTDIWYQMMAYLETIPE